MAKIEFKPLSDAVSKGDVRKAPILPALPHPYKYIVERSGITAHDILVLDPGDKILRHRHNPGEKEIYIIFKGETGVAELQVCPAEQMHELENDSDKVWIIIAIKTKSRLVLHNPGITLVLGE